MNGNNDRIPDSSGFQHRDKTSITVSIAKNIYERLSSMSGLALSAVVLVPVIAVLLYAALLSSRERELAEANREMDFAIEAYEQGDIEESLKAIREVKNDFPNLKIAEYYEGIILFGLEEDRRSLESMENFLSGSPDNMLRPDALFMAGFSSFQLKQWEKSIAYFEELLSVGIPSYNKRVLPLLGTAYINTGNGEKAEAAYSQFINLFPDLLESETETGSDKTTESPTE